MRIPKEIAFGRRARVRFYACTGQTCDPGTGGSVPPTLVVAGGQCSPVPQGQIADLRRLPEGLMFTVDAGHLVHATEPDAFIRNLLHFSDA